MILFQKEFDNVGFYIENVNSNEGTRIQHFCFLIYKSKTRQFIEKNN